MPKDLRQLLQPAKGTERDGSLNVVPLAQRRSLSSPGEPRVFRVKAGFVCGLCGKVHPILEAAFECVSRCTIELRLRTPAGRMLSGNLGHYACSACGRGFANTDDATECFEKCLVRLKPDPRFEQTLRSVQARYQLRLKSHGTRSLSRIDPLHEHTKMLRVLTQEQRALGRASMPAGAVPPSESQPVLPPDALMEGNVEEMDATESLAHAENFMQGLNTAQETAGIEAPAMAGLEESSGADEAAVLAGTDAGESVAAGPVSETQLETAGETDSAAGALLEESHAAAPEADNTQGALSLLSGESNEPDSAQAGSDVKALLDNSSLGADISNAANEQDADALELLGDADISGAGSAEESNALALLEGAGDDPKSKSGTPAKSSAMSALDALDFDNFEEKPAA